MKDLLDKIFPTLSDELIIVISLIIGLLVTASLILFLVKKIFPKTNISELAARTRSWWIMAGMFIGAVFISYNISYFFLAFLSFIAFRELYSVLGFREADRGALFWGILAIPIQYYLAYLAWYGAFIIFIPVVMFLVLPLRLVLKGDTHGITKSMALLQWILMLSEAPPPARSLRTGISSEVPWATCKRPASWWISRYFARTSSSIPTNSSKPG